MMLTFAYPWVIGIGFVLGLFVWFVRAYYIRKGSYRYALTHLCLAEGSHARISHIPTWLIRWSRITIFVLLVLATARPRSPNQQTEIVVDGIGIMLALDVSNSMYCFDDLRNPQSRFHIAQAEAIRFVDRRNHDLCGLLLFGEIVATRCPLTSDRRLVTDIIRQTHIGIISGEGTALSQAIIMGVRRLQSSKTASNILVLLTDGEPSPEDRPLLETAIELARQAHVRIYTIGIGSPEGGYAYHATGAVMRVENRLQLNLLRAIAQKTGGLAFEARNQHELAAIYDTIDRLETTSQREPLYAQWHEWYTIFVLAALLLLLIEVGILAWHKPL
jgi:Ca-activated chloride channel family protein